MEPNLSPNALACVPGVKRSHDYLVFLGLRSQRTGAMKVCRVIVEVRHASDVCPGASGTHTNHGCSRPGVALSYSRRLKKNQKCLAIFGVSIA